MLELGGAIVSVLDRSGLKTYDYINRVVLTLPLSVYEGMWTRSALLLLCITMILRVRRIFLKLLRSPSKMVPPLYCTK